MLLITDPWDPGLFCFKNTSMEAKLKRKSNNLLEKSLKGNEGSQSVMILSLLRKSPPMKQLLSTRLGKGIPTVTS